MTTMRGRHWTALDNHLLRSGYRDGLRPAVLAAQLGRTVPGVVRQQHRLGLRASDHPFLSAAAVAQRLGLGDRMTITAWVRRGWLRPAGGRRCRPWRFDPFTLWDLCANPAAMLAWDAQRITDAELRAYALEQRARHPRWLRIRDVAARYHVAPVTVNGWVTQGRFAPAHLARYQGLWIREDALDGFVPPCEQRWVRTVCCRRRVPVGTGTPPAALLICQACWPQVRVLPGGHLLRLLPPAGGTSTAATPPLPQARERRAA